MTLRDRGALVVLVCLSALLVSTDLVVGKKRGPTMDIEDGVLDGINLKLEKIDAGRPVVLRKFSVEDVDLGTGAKGGKKKRVQAAQTMVKVAPDILLEKLASDLKESNLFPDVIIADEGAPIPEGAIVIEGRFTTINPGSRAKRYWGGFGAGKSGVGVEGKVIDASGSLLAEFRHMKHSGIGIGGGNYVKFLTDDTEDVGKDVAKFRRVWAMGGDLTED